MKTSRRKDGRLERQITLHDAITGQSYTKHVYARDSWELEEKVRKLKAQYSGLAHAGYTVGSFVAYYMKARRDNDRGTGTLDTYDNLVRNYIMGTKFSGMRIETVSVPACRQFLNSFRPVDPNAEGGRTKEALYAFLHMVFGQAWREKVIQENPWDYIEKPYHEPEERTVLTNEQFEQLLTALPTERMRRLFRFARNTGMRRGEICGIALKDLHLEDGFVQVRTAQKLAKKQWVNGKPKNKVSIRNVAIPPTLVELILEQLQYLQHLSTRNGIALTEDTPLWVSENMEPYAASSLSNAFLRARRKCGFPDSMSFHSLRATVATYLAECNVNAKKIQAKLGHATPTMTLTRYVKNTPQMQDGLTDLLDQLEKGASQKSSALQLTTILTTFLQQKTTKNNE